MALFALNFYDRILYIFNYIVAWVMVRLHDLLIFLGMEKGPKFAWVLAIIGLTLLVRAAIIPLYAKQIRSQRAMQEIQPKMKEIRDKYKGRKDQVSRQQMNQEVMALYRDFGVNPLASCLPLIIQAPFIIALYRVLLNTVLIARGHYGEPSLGPITRSVAQEIEKTRFLGIPLSTTFSDASKQGNTLWMTIIILLAVVTAIIMFSSMWLLSVKNLPKNSSDQNAKMMRMMAFFGPAMTLVFSFAVQMGVLIYWLITNIFTAVQQMVILQKAPTQGSPAYDRFIAKATKKYDAYAAQENNLLIQKFQELGLNDHQVSVAKNKILKAEAKIQVSNSHGENENIIEPSRFTSVRKIRKKMLEQKLHSVQAEETKKRLGDNDPLSGMENADNLHQAVALRRQLDARLSHKKIVLGIERPIEKRKPRKKGFFAKKMEEAVQLQEQQKRDQRKGQRNQPTRSTRARRGNQNEEQDRKKELLNKTKLSPEEIEKRRQQRRQEARNRSKKKRKK